MARFIVIHQLKETANSDFQDMRAARKHLFQLAENPDVQWLNGWWVFESAQQVCEYEAKDKATIVRALEESGIQDLMPVTRIDEVMLSGPHDFPGEFSEP
jgi:hypothetical protein